LARHHEKATAIWGGGPSARRASRRTLPLVPTKTTSKPKTASSADPSLAALMVVLALTSVWFVSQALAYWQ
jgi:hypothetical protein